MGSPPPSSPPTPPPPYEELHPHDLTSAPAPASGSDPAPSLLPPAPSQPPVPSQPPATKQPPPLPARQQDPAQYLSAGPAPTLRSTAETYNDWKLPPDPRTSSTQSLHSSGPHSYAASPSLSASSVADPQGRRTLLLIYIHGFLGNDLSFRSFPAHVHALLTNMLADSHVIHSKIYPRYKTYRAVDVARDNFSAWLTPHESPTTDVILVGHSMGGILAADIVLMPNQSPYGQHPFKHRILGHISLDCPFLGLHPGIIVSGISSLFKPSPQPQEPTVEETTTTTTAIPTDASSIYTLEPTAGFGASPASPAPSSLHLAPPQALSPGSAPSISSSVSGPSSSVPSDPFFNPPFFNDVPFREQPFVRRALHFASKYRDENLFSATAKHFISYLEFGGVLADQSGLESRYLRLRALEEVDELQQSALGKVPGGPTAKVRFVNYYTMCTGRPKVPKPGAAKPESQEVVEGDEAGIPDTQEHNITDETPSRETGQENDPADSNLSLEKVGLDAKSQPKTSTETSKSELSTEEPSEKPKTSLASSVSGAASELTPQNTANDDAESISSDIDQLSLQSVDPTPIEESCISNQDFELDLPPIPDEPTPPDLPNLDLYTDKDSRKQAEREVKRLQRAYEQAVKDRAKAIHEREKIVEKRRKRALKESEKQKKGARKEAEKEEKETRKEMEKEEKMVRKESERQDKETRKETERKEKEARKEAERQEKEARKEVERQEKEARKEAERKEKEAQREQRRLEKEAHRLEKEMQRQRGNSSLSPYEPNQSRASSSSSSVNGSNTQGPDAKPRKLRQFCNLPDPAPTATGGYARDRTWVEVFMPDVDEVGAHCGLFIPGPQYERLVGDVGTRVVGWVHEDMTRRTILEMGN